MSIRFLELLSFCKREVFRRKTRSLLTIMGIAVGCASIVIMVSLGRGINKEISDQIKKSKTLNIITIYEPEEKAGKKNPVLNREVIASFLQISHVRSSSPVYMFNALIQHGKYEKEASITGITLEMINELGLNIIAGEIPKEDSAFCFIACDNAGDDFYAKGQGITVAPGAVKTGPRGLTEIELYGTSVTFIPDRSGYQKYVNGDSISKPKSFDVSVAAEYQEDQQGYGMHMSNMLLADLDKLEEIMKKTFGSSPWPEKPLTSSNTEIRYRQAYVVVDDIKNVQSVVDYIEDMGYITYSEMATLNYLNEESKRAQYSYGAIGAVSMIVASLGIMNTMMMSVLEQKKEIGIYKVVGCRDSQIRDLFMTEAAIIGGIGGIAGIAFGLVIVWVLNSFNNIHASVSLLSVVLTFLFSILCSVAFGTMPAIRAMRIPPAEALRYE